MENEKYPYRDTPKDDDTFDGWVSTHDSVRARRALN